MKKLYKTLPMIAILLGLLLGTSGCIVHTDPPCYPGRDGLPGQAFLELDWTTVTPSYVWTNNTAIPPVFRYGTFYQSYTGTWDLYYEGSYFAGCCPVEFFWDVRFDIWAHPGTYAQCGYDGINGPDSYLTLLLDPNGPIEQRINKTGTDGDVLKVISQTDKEIIVEKSVGEVTMRITYTKLEKSRRAELDPTGAKTGTK